jgi:acyl-CoA synthetase (AMP-forming)/AMP-acid ligase II
MVNYKFDFLWQYVEYWAITDPDYIAMRYEDRSYTYLEFEVLTNKIATEFLHLGIRKGDMIASMLPSSPEYIMTLIAADKIGAIVTALDVKYKSADLKNFISHIKPKVVLSLAKSDDFDVANALKLVESELKLKNSINYFFVGNAEFGNPFENIYKGKPEFKEELIKHKTAQHINDGMVVIFTGGTTGVPKAALLSKQNVTAMAVAENEIISKALIEKGVIGRIKTIACLPPSHVGGTVELIGSSIVSGSEMLIHDTWSPKRVLETVQNEKISWIGCVPTMYAIMTLMSDIDQYDLSSLKMVLLSGEKVEKKLLQQIRSKICPNLLIGYGSTEAGSELTFTEFLDSDDKLADGYVGKALKGVDIKIVDDSGNILPYGEIGEIQISGQFTINNYYQMPEEDEAGFTKDGFCKSGDKGYLTEDGGLYIKGRIKHIIRVGSYTVMPSEVEDIAIKHPSVGMAAAIGVPDEVLGEVVWLVVSPTLGNTIKEEELIAFCKNELAKYKVPQKIIIEKELPISRIGKVLRIEIQNKIIKSLKEDI